MPKKFEVVKKTKDSVVLKGKDGKQFALLTPTGKNKRYGRELKSGVNSRTGKKLNDCAAGYRMGYRAALGELAKRHNSWKQKKGK